MNRIDSDLLFAELSFSYEDIERSFKFSYIRSNMIGYDAQEFWSYIFSFMSKFWL